MRFYFDLIEHGSGYFESSDIIQAIYSVWIVGGSLYLQEESDFYYLYYTYESNEFNNKYLKKYGFSIEENDTGKVLVDLKTMNTIRMCDVKLIDLI